MGETSLVPHSDSSTIPPRNSPEIDDNVDILTPTIFSGENPVSGPYTQTPPRSMDDDWKRPTPDQAKSRSSRRGSRSQLAKSHRSSSSHPQPSPAHGYGTPAASSTDSIQNRHPGGFQGPSLQYPTTTTSPYAQGPGYVTQYTMSSQPAPMLPHTPPSYGFSHTYHHPGVPDNNVTQQQNIHANYQPMFQAPGSYPSHQVNPASPPASSHAPPGQGIPLSPSYVGPSSPLHSLRYPTTLTTSPYAYPQSFLQSPMYRPQFTPSTYGQHYSPTGDAEPQGTWYYLPHPTPSQQTYDPGPSYQGHYPMTYPQVGHPPVPEARLSSSANPASSSYPISPSQTFSHQYQADNPSSDATHASIVDPRAQSSGNSVSSSERHQPLSDRPVVRRSYHPNPPAHRSEWVMWVGNVPSDATHDELWRFFNTPPEPPSRVSVGESPANGVLSIFLISRSGCAFVNYESERCLDEAISRFNGVPLRSHQPRCPQLVCRVRRIDDDLKAGVGGQRGTGMHRRWVQEQKGKAREHEEAQSEKLASDDPSTPPSTSDTSELLANPMANLSLSSDEDGKRGAGAKHSSSSESYASTNSSFLTNYFPERYFILKSLTQEDLDTSVVRGIWATQKHNEEILDQAFRTSKRVNLIFGVNKSGEFYGYAKMSGPVRRQGRRVSWALRSSPRPSSTPSKSHLHSPHPPPFFSPSDHRLVDASPFPVDEPNKDGRFMPNIQQANASTAVPTQLHQSAPALLGGKYHLPTFITPSEKHSLDQSQRKRFQPLTHQGSVSADGFDLDPSAPARAVRSKQGISPSSGLEPDGQKKASGSGKGSILQNVEEEEEQRGGELEVVDKEEGDRKEGPAEGQEANWGDSFAVEWISTQRVPFHRTRHLRNPWNHDREVKVSRDGTELEPSVGQRLLEEWDKLSDPQGPPMLVALPDPTSVGKRGRGVKHRVSPLPLPEGLEEGTSNPRPLQPP